MMRFKVWRSGKGGKDGTYVNYEGRASPGMSVLDALFAIHEKHDDSLAFRYSCRGAVCGSCAMTVNREPRLACRTQVLGLGKMKPSGLRPFEGLEKKADWDRSSEIIIEPLPNMPILKDLVVDMTGFYEHYRKVKPWMEMLEDAKTYSRMTPLEMSKVEKYANCILCACCNGACPVCEKNARYLGPAALSWSLRFVDDGRVPDRKERLSLVEQDDGVPGCEFVYNCVKVCPKDVAPAKAIRTLKNYIEKGR